MPACQGVLKYCLNDLLNQEQRKTLFLFLDTVKSTLAESHKAEEISSLKERMNIALALLERDFPIAIQVYSYIQY